MYKTQLEYLDQQKDLEISENEVNKKKLDDFLQKELEKNNKLNAEIKSLQDRTSQLDHTRTELFKQLKTMEKLHNEKQYERDELKNKAQAKEIQLETKRRDLDEREIEVRQLREKLRAVQQKVSAQKLIGGQDVYDKYNEEH